MKKLSYLGVFAFAIISMLTYTSCDEGLPGSGNSSQPILNLSDANGGVLSDFNVASGSIITINVSGVSSGDNPMQSVKFQENGTNIPAARLSYDGSPAAANPALLLNGNENSFNWTVDITVQSTVSLNTYSVIITDTEGNEDSESFSVDTDLSGNAPLAVEFIETNPYTWMDYTNPSPGSSFTVGLIANPNPGSAFFSLTILENGTAITDLSRLEYRGNALNENPSGFTVADEAGFTDLDIQVTTPTTSGVYTYEFRIEDNDGSTESVSLTVTNPNPSTPLTNTLTGVLLNAGGPVGQGGLDLDHDPNMGTGGTGSDDVDAEIRDQGIDTNQSPSENWKQRIAPITANGVTMRVQTGASTDITDASFDSVDSQEAIINAYNGATDTAQSALVQVGDVFLINRGNRYFVIKCTNVVETDADNTDYYEFSIKY